MIFKRETSPFIRKNVSVKRMMLDVIIALVPIVLFASIQNGWKGIYVILTAVITMLLAEFVAVALMKWPDGMLRREMFTKEGFKKIVSNFNINNIFCPIISALIFSLLLPAATPVYVVIVGSLVGIIFGKLVFGPYGGNIFNPAAVGFVFVLICFSGQLDAARITATGVIRPDLIENGVIAGGTPLGQIKDNLGNFGEALGTYSIKDLLLGNIPGAMGEVCSLLIIIAFIYLAIRRAIDVRATIGMILGFGLVTLSVGITLYCINGTNVLDFLLYEILAGGLLFGAVFMITDPVTSPVTKFGRLFFGVFAGLMVALIRFIGGYPEGTAFAILFANMIASALDYFMQGKKNSYSWIQLGVTFVVIVCISLIVCYTVAGRTPMPEVTTYIGGLLK